MTAITHLKSESSQYAKQRTNGRRKPGRNPSRYPENEYIQRLLQVHELYIRFGTLQRVADHLNLTREWVRQLLMKGHKYKLFKFELTEHPVVNQLRQRISKQSFTRAIRNGATQAAICSKFHIDRASCLKLLKAYQIDPHSLFPKGRGRGFASMDRDRQVRVASAGGKAAHAKGTAHRWTREEASRAGKIGGSAPKVSPYK